MQPVPESVDELRAALGDHAYLADRGLSTAIYLSLSLGKPLLLEGEAGVGKTEVAKVLSTLLDRELIRLQCYEGIDASQALYEWNYSRQLIAVRAMDASEADADVRGPVRRPSSWWSGRCWRRSARAIAPCCWSTSSTAPTTSSRRSCSRSCRSSR